MTDPTPEIEPARVLAALDVLGWPDDRGEQYAEDSAVMPPEAHYRLAEDVIRAADAARKQALADALADCVVKATPYGIQDGDFVANYIMPTGPIHRAIPLLEQHGITVRPGFDGRTFTQPEEAPALVPPPHPEEAEDREGRTGDDVPRCTLPGGTCYCTGRAGCLAANEDAFDDPNAVPPNLAATSTDLGAVA